MDWREVLWMPVPHVLELLDDLRVLELVRRRARLVDIRAAIHANAEEFGQFDDALMRAIGTEDGEP